MKPGQTPSGQPLKEKGAPPPPKEVSTVKSYGSVSLKQF